MPSFLKPLVATAMLASLALPFAPAEAQWVFVARKALGRIHQMTEGSQPDGRAGYDFATVLLDAHADKIFSTALGSFLQPVKIFLMEKLPSFLFLDQRKASMMRTTGQK